MGEFHVLAFHILKFDDLTAVLLKVQNFWNVALCRWGYACCLYVSGKLSKYRHHDSSKRRGLRHDVTKIENFGLKVVFHI